MARKSSTVNNGINKKPRKAQRGENCRCVQTRLKKHAQKQSTLKFAFN